MSDRCILVLGGSFDPVHNGHVALANYFATLLHPEALRIVPAGDPWQKAGLRASADDRVEMVRAAFRHLAVPIEIDRQEILRQGPSYSIDTLRALRTELGPRASIAFLLGADQLERLQTWKDWQQLFDYAHVCAASRPGFTVDAARLAPEVAREMTRRTATAAQLRTTPHGLAHIAANLAIDVSSTQIRQALQDDGLPASLLPAGVLDYIKQHHLYRT